MQLEVLKALDACADHAGKPALWYSLEALGLIVPGSDTARREALRRACRTLTARRVLESGSVSEYSRAASGRYTSDTAGVRNQVVVRRFPTSEQLEEAAWLQSQYEGHREGSRLLRESRGAWSARDAWSKLSAEEQRAQRFSDNWLRWYNHLEFGIYRDLD